MAKKPIKFLVLAIKKDSDVTFEYAVDVCIRWTSSREKADVSRFEQEKIDFLAHKIAYENKEVSFPPMLKPTNSQSYMVFLVDSRLPRLYIVNSLYVQSNYGLPEYLDLGSKDIDIENLKLLLGINDNLNDKNTENEIPISILALANLDEIEENI